MSDDPDKDDVPEAIEIQCYFVRERNALLVRGDFSPIYTDYYLHLMQHGIRHRPEQDLLLKDGLVALGLHLAARPWNEAIAWTLSWQDPLQNVFITGSNRDGNLVGRLFTEDVRERDENLFISQVSVAGREPRQTQSEQRPARYFRHSDDDFLMISAQPECDLDWLLGLDEEAIREMDQKETLSLLEVRNYRFHCGCGPERIYPIIANMNDESLEAVFGGGEVIAAGCPRCGARYTITSEALEAFRRDQAK